MDKSKKGKEKDKNRSPGMKMEQQKGPREKTIQGLGCKYQQKCRFPSNNYSQMANIL